MSKYEVTGYSFSGDGDSFAIINNDERFKIDMNDIATKIIEEYSLKEDYKSSITHQIAHKLHKMIKETGISPDTVLLSEEYYGALIYENKVKSHYLTYSKNKHIESTSRVMGLKIRKCEGYDVMVVYVYFY